MIIDSYANINKNDETLRPYQRKAKKEIFEAWDEVNSVMFQMPTGTGKTRLFTSIIRDINDYSIRRREAVKILIIAHRTELIDQIDASLKKYGVPHNLISGRHKREIKYPVHVASIQTITNKSNLEKAKKLNVQFVIIDEAHHALAKTYKKLWKMYPDARFLGVTATPWRMNHESFTDLFDRLILSMPVKDFINQGYLAPYKYFSLKGDSDIQKTIDDIELDRFGEYKESSMEEKMDIGRIRAQLLDSYLSLAEGKKGIIYAINIKHAKHICKEYEEAGYKTVSIDSKTPAAERKYLVEKFKKGDIDIIVNVDIFSEGFDCPDIEFIQLARPTRSLVKYLQQVGRGLRITENKQDCVILDNVGMYSRFGLPNARRHWKQHFLGKKIDETPTSVGVSFGGSGRSREFDISEGTEDMELIQDLNDDLEVIDVPKVGISAIDELFPIFGITPGKTTVEQAEKLGGEYKIDEDTGDLILEFEKIQFYTYGDGILTDFYWKKNDHDFPKSWKFKGFSWDNSYDEWINVFNRQGYKIEIEHKPEQEMYDGRFSLSGYFSARSQDNSLSFCLDFKYGEKGCYTSSPSTLYSISVYYKGHPEDEYDEKDEEEEEIIENPEVPKEVDAFDPFHLLEANNYKDENFVFWFNDTRKIYEAYIQDDTYYIISELIIDEKNKYIHRNRVGKISMNSWMFWQMEREKVDNLKSIVHYGANCTVFHYQVLDKDNFTKDKYFDYKGREITSPSEVKEKYEIAKREGRGDDYIDIPVSKATFDVEILGKNKHTKLILINRTIKNVVRTIATLSLKSDFYSKFNVKSGVIINARKVIGKARILELPRSITIYRSDARSFAVRCEEKDAEYLYRYDLKGNLINKGTIAKYETPREPSLSQDNIDKLSHVFDKKATSYKYFWFLSIMHIYKRHESKTISNKHIIAKMISNAWRYVYYEKSNFPSIDWIPKYVNEIKERYLLDDFPSESKIEGQIKYFYERDHLDRMLAPLLNNVPYRFLSPWIPFTSNEDVVAKSNEKDSVCPYSIHDDYIVINPMWREYLKEHYNEIVQFIEVGLRQYLRIK